jgi:Kef-type K+ transport system membrane component KefB
VVSDREVVVLKAMFPAKGVLAIGLAAAMSVVTPAFAGSAAGAHANPVAPVLITLTVLLLAAKLGGDLFERLGQPAVLGELLFGVLLGNLNLLGYEHLTYLKHDQALQVFAELGVILLLFEIGLETNVRDMLSVGPSSALVALLGVIVPIILGLGTSFMFHPEQSIYLHVFIGATLCATSVGVTARVLRDLGCIQRRESRIVLGAAVIDDVLGLIVLATMTGVIAAAQGDGPGLSLGMLAAIAGKALAFVFGAVTIGYFLSPRLLAVAARFRVQGMLLTTALLICFLLSYLADRLGLAPIVGAFAAGLIIEPRHAEVFRERGVPALHQLFNPLVAFLAPLFFVRMGLLVDLRVLGDVSVLGFAVVLTAAAIIGKQACALGVLEHGLDRLSVGLGMIPRGEVGLIFANIGAAMTLRGAPVIGAEQFSAVVIMVMVTTLVTPPLLRWSLSRQGSAAGHRRALDA